MSDLFSLSVHHGGYFSDNSRKYVGGNVDIVDNCDPDRWSKTENEGICKEFRYTSVSRIWYKMPGSDLERANFHLIIDDDDTMFMTNLVIGHEEIHVFLEHPMDNPILVDEGEHVRANVQPLAVEQNLLGHGSNDDGSNDEGSDNSTNGSEDYNNNNEDHIEIDDEQAYSRRESNTPMVDNDDVVEVDTAEVYSRRAGKEPVTQHPSEDKDVVDNKNSGGDDGEGSGLKDEDVVNPNEREFMEDSSDSWDGCDENVTEPVQMSAGVMNSDYDSKELHSLEESSSDDDIGDDTDDSSEDELKTLVRKGKGQRKTFPVFKPVVKGEHIRFEKDILLTTLKQFKEVITDYAIYGSWGIRFAKNDLQRVRAVCQEKCKFMAYLTKLPKEKS
nr:hypothetical protein CFP56_15750 [Quercus suber]